MIRTAAVSTLLLVGNVITKDLQCMSPGICEAPTNYKFSSLRKTEPRSQWITDGGFCGSMSIQTLALSHGVYIS